MPNPVQLPSRYDAYRDPGVWWLGVVPEHWEVRRVKFLFREINERCADGSGDLLSVSQYTGVTRRSDKVGESDLLTNAESLEGYKKVREGDLVSNIMLAWNGSLAFSGYDGITSPAYAVYRLNTEFYTGYYNYLLRTEIYKSEFKRRSSGVIESRLRLYTDDFYDVRALVPPLNEQTAIAAFLDRKTAQIDEAVAIKQRQIALLKERKQILIQNAVTRGLDPSVPMRDSGVEWIGDIPAHWSIEPIKHSLSGIVDCEHKTAPFVEEKEYLVVRTTNVKDGKLTLKDAKYTTAKGFELWTKRGIPEPGDILLTREAPAGEACLVPRETKLCLGQRMVWLKVSRAKALPEFLLLLIYSKLVRTYIDFLSAGSTVLHFNMSDIKNIPIINVPMEEQAAIVAHVEKDSQQLEKALRLLEIQIIKLKEYKATLINSAVTGKIKVPGVEELTAKAEAVA